MSSELEILVHLSGHAVLGLTSAGATYASFRHAGRGRISSALGAVGASIAFGAGLEYMQYLGVPYAGNDPSALDVVSKDMPPGIFAAGICVGAGIAKDIYSDLRQMPTL